jgi:O-antigen/teichoic acid export membrane protein
LVDSVEQPSAPRIPLPEGTIPVAIGLLIAGVSSFAFFRVGTVALGDEEAFKPVISMWFATFALAPGMFLPLEQELGRALSARRALGQGGYPVLYKVAVLGTALAIAVTLGIAVVSPWLTESYFDGNAIMVVALAVSIAAYAPTHLARGTCSGMGRFRSYAVVLGADGLVRIALCLVLAALGVNAVGWYGMAVAIAPLVGVIAVASRRQLHTDPGPEAAWQEVTPNLGWLLLGSVMAAALVNAGPIAATVLADEDEAALVTLFGYGVILARVPLFLFQAVQAALLPRLSRLAATGEMAEFRQGFARLMRLVLLVGAAGVVGAYVLGPFAVQTLYDADLTRRTLAMLALGSAFYMIGLAFAQAVIALHGHALVALGWTTGMIVFVLTTWLVQGEVFRRVELGLLLGSGAAMVVFWISLRRRLAAGAVPDQGSIMEAITDMPLEG